MYVEIRFFTSKAARDKHFKRSGNVLVAAPEDYGLKSVEIAYSLVQLLNKTLGTNLETVAFVKIVRQEDGKQVEKGYAKNRSTASDWLQA